MKLPTIQHPPFDCVLFGAYSDDIEANAALHKRALVQLMQEGVTVFSQIAMLHDVAKEHGTPTDAEPYRDLSLAGIRASACAVFITPEKLDTSDGMQYEMALCPLHDCPIIFWYTNLETPRDTAAKVFAYSRKELEMPKPEVATPGTILKPGELYIKPQPKFFRVNDDTLIELGEVKQVLKTTVSTLAHRYRIQLLKTNELEALPDIKFRDQEKRDEMFERLAAWK